MSSGFLLAAPRVGEYKLVGHGVPQDGHQSAEVLMKPARAGILLLLVLAPLQVSSQQLTATRLPLAITEKDAVA